MTIDLWMLVASCALAMFLSSVPLFRAMRQQWGFKKMLGNREDVQPLQGWGGRVVRTYNNLMDNNFLFGVAVILAHITEAANETTAFAAQVYFAARVAHAVFYIGGLHTVRTVAYLAGAIATIVIAAQL